MRRFLTSCIAAAVAAICLPCWAQDAAAKPPANPALDAARNLTMTKCFQCHAASMWIDQRLDARGWEATLYRMVGRGAAWSRDDVKAMASYLATDYGPNSPKPEPARR